MFAVHNRKQQGKTSRTGNQAIQPAGSAVEGSLGLDLDFTPQPVHDLPAVLSQVRDQVNRNIPGSILKHVRDRAFEPVAELFQRIEDGVG
jgi:hypothetical protein